MKCSVCGSGPMTDGASIFRNGPFGEKTDWRCERHLPKEKRKPEVMELVATIESVFETKQ